MTDTQQQIFNQELINRRLGAVQHQIKLQNVSKGAPSPQKRKRSKSKSNLTILKQINGQERR